VRNAWREIWLRFPGTRNWKCAHACRTEQQKRDQTPRVSPAESMATAAAAMSAALKTALLLVEQTSTQAAQHVERRLAPLRRESDRLHDDIAFE
jgi:predicted metal-binding protein